MVRSDQKAAFFTESLQRHTLLKVVGKAVTELASIIVSVTFVTAKTLMLPQYGKIIIRRIIICLVYNLLKSISWIWVS